MPFLGFSVTPTHPNHRLIRFSTLYFKNFPLLFFFIPLHTLKVSSSKLDNVLSQWVRIHIPSPSKHLFIVSQTGLLYTSIPNYNIKSIHPTTLDKIM